VADADGANGATATGVLSANSESGEVAERDVDAEVGTTDDDGLDWAPAVDARRNMIPSEIAKFLIA
jgi:hypothetical protein